MNLPSRFQLNDTVRVGKHNGVITGVCFRVGKVYYEVGGIMHLSEDVNEPLKVVPMEKIRPYGWYVVTP